MILEIAFVEILPDKTDEFEVAIKRAVSEVLSTSKGFIDFEMHRGIERNNTYTFHIHWETLEDYTIGFRQSEQFALWRGIIGQYFAQSPLVEHWQAIELQ
jgi:heme-degrading monooxygenase HmoA